MKLELLSEPHPRFDFDQEKERYQVLYHQVRILDAMGDHEHWVLTICKP